VIKVVIIDDDVEMLFGLKRIIDWEKYGYTVIGQAENGEKGLEIIKIYKPEVVITDITMPAMNGFDLIEKAKSIVPDIKPVILTCHEDFSYAKHALKLSVYDYVVKYTLTEEGLINIIMNLKEKIYSERNINARIITISEEIKHNKEVLKQNLLMNLINSNNTDPNLLNIYKEAEILNIQLPDNAFALIGVFIDNFELSITNSRIHSKELLAFGMENIFDDVCKVIGKYSFFNYSDDFKIILIWKNTEYDNMFDVTLNNTLQNYQKDITRFLNIETSICISSIYDDILQIHKAFKQCENLRNEYFYKGSLTIVTEEKVKWNSYTSLYSRYKNEWLKVLLENNTENIEKIMNFIRKLSFEIVDSNYSPGEVKKLFHSLIIDVKSAANKDGININYANGFDTFDACVKSLKDAVIIYSKGLQDALNGSFRVEIKKVLAYIDENLSGDISCEKMAEYINMNTNYFSRLFKKQIGVSFSDYVIKKRIDKAAYFLKYSEMSVEEIAELTGFVNVSYFYKAFKKVTGRTPGGIRSKQ
jgi:two-component system, response regulator YesN